MAKLTNGIIIVYFNEAQCDGSSGDGNQVHATRGHVNAYDVDELRQRWSWLRRCLLVYQSY